MMRRPVVDLSLCIRCGICVELCPEVFAMADAGFVAVTEMNAYPEAEVDEAIKCCPADCIYWEDA
jgi:ferredoxin